MNEQQNTALIQSEYDAFARGDVQTILSNLADDVEWVLEGPASIPFSGRKNGPAQVAKFFEAIGSSLRNPKLTIEQTIAQGDSVASIGRFSGTVAATGKTFDVPIAHFFTVRNGKIARFVDFGDTAALAEAYTKTSAATGD